MPDRNPTGFMLFFSFLFLCLLGLTASSFCHFHSVFSWVCRKNQYRKDKKWNDKKTHINIVSGVLHCGGLKVHKHEIILNFFLTKIKSLYSLRKFSKKISLLFLRFSPEFWSSNIFAVTEHTRNQIFFLREISKNFFFQNVHLGPIRWCSATAPISYPASLSNFPNGCQGHPRF